MLKNINPILNADVLYALHAMGHGDDLIIADTNFPPDSVTRETVVGEVQAKVLAAGGSTMIGIERFAFYERSKKAYAVIQTGERRFYGCFAFRKGVIPPDEVQ